VHCVLLLVIFLACKNIIILLGIGKRFLNRSNTTETCSSKTEKKIQRRRMILKYVTSATANSPHLPDNFLTDL